MSTSGNPDLSALEHVRSVAVARIGLDGAVLAANDGFRRLMPGDTENSSVLGFFFRPGFADFLAALPEGDGPVYRGLFSVGHAAGRATTLSGHLTRVGDTLHFFAEHDIDAYDSLQEKVLGLNQDLAEARRQVARMNRDLEALVARRTAELSASETRFRTLVEQSLVGIGILQEGRFRYVNPALVAMAGYAAAADMVNGMGFIDLVTEADREHTALELAGIGSTTQAASHLAGLNGDGPQVEWHGSPCGYEGRPAVIVILIDVTERRRAEAARDRALA